MPHRRRFYASVLKRGGVDTEFVRLDIEHEGQRWLIEGDVEVVLRRIEEEIEEDLLEDIVASTKTKEAGGAVGIFNALLEELDVIRRPEEVLLAIHSLRSVDGDVEIPPRVIEGLFKDAGMKPPGNLSLYMNRLRERGLIEVPDVEGQKNRHAYLTDEGRRHLGL